MDITTNAAPTMRLSWRRLGLVALLLALLLATFVAVGSLHRVPAPFGVARNGLIAYAADGDLYTTDPLTGERHPIVTGPEFDRRPAFSRDGTRLAFMRVIGDKSADTFSLMLAASDGSKLRAIPNLQMHDEDLFEWAPDGSYLMVVNADGLTRYDATGSAAPVTIAKNARFVSGSFRPPDGREILVQPDDPTGFTLSVIDAQGKELRKIWHVSILDSSPNDLQEFLWSPDGNHIAFLLGIDGRNDQTRVFVMNADGSDVRRLSNEAGAWVDADLVWSPDSKRIAFNRWRLNGGGGWDIQPIGVVSVDGGPVSDAGPAPVSDGAAFDWSPDGASIVSIPATVLKWPVTPMTSARPTLIDPTDGSSRLLDWTVGSAATWQRLAP
jgi:Tol biopolymer transport system component